MVNKECILKRIISKVVSVIKPINNPIADGTFIQSDMVESWSDSKWLSEFKYLKEVRMNYVIMGSSVTKGDITETYYPSNLKGTVNKYPNVDMIDILLRNAEKAGIKVFIGINHNDDWWEKGPRDPVWLYEQMETGNLISDELYNKYKLKYPNAFYGWYFIYEVDNLNFKRKNDFSVMARAINILLKHQEEKGHRLPFMISPFMNSKYGTAKVYGDNWAYLFQNTDLGKGDIFAPQDSVGGGGLNINEVSKWFKELRKAVDIKPGLLFWANTETFDHTNWTSANLRRFVNQMRLENDYVDNIITFAYSHYYSPNNIDSRFHKNYLEYIKCGHLKGNKPMPPTNITVKRLGNLECLITWDEGKSNIGIYGYELYKNGKKIFSTFQQRFYGGKKEGLLMSFTDKPKVICKLWSCVYEVRSVDFNGDVSEGRKVVFK